VLRNNEPYNIEALIEKDLNPVVKEQDVMETEEDLQPEDKWEELKKRAKKEKPQGKKFKKRWKK